MKIQQLLTEARLIYCQALLKGAAKVVLVHRRLLESTTFWSVLLFALAVLVAVRSGLPERARAAFAKTNERFVTKVPRIYLNPPRTDVLIIGSSLVQVPSVRCDDEMLLGRTRYDTAYYDYVFQYEKNLYLQSLLRAGLGSDIQLLNGAVAATTLADHYLLLKTFLERGGSCKVALLCISPREMHDNYHPVPEKTQVYEVVGDPFSLSALKARGVEECFSMVWKRVNPLFADRIQIQRWLTALEKRAVFSTPIDKPKPNYVQPKNTLHDIAMWNNIYNPVNFKMYSMQVGYLEKLLNLANEHKIKVVIVEMPLPKANTVLIRDDLKERFEADLVRVSQRYGAQLVHPAREESYQLSDFEDGGHMVPSGGRKLFKQIAGYVCGNTALREQLAGAPGPQAM